MRAAIALSFVALALALAAPPAGADWLVMRDGTRIETRGAWAQKGRLVVFTSADGRLASLRADTVDLGASRRVTAEAAAAASAAEREAAAPAAPAPTPRAVRRITNADIPTGTPPPAAGAAAAAEGEEGSALATTRDLQVRDSAQEIDPGDGHLIVRGRLANTSQRTAAAIELVVQAHGPDGAVLASLPAELDQEALPPGASTAFEAHFLDVYSGAFGLRFAPAATFLESRPPDETEGSGEPGDGARDAGFDGRV